MVAATSSAKVIANPLFDDNQSARVSKVNNNGKYVRLKVPVDVAMEEPRAGLYGNVESVPR